jgi:hypothetical protein
MSEGLSFPSPLRVFVIRFQSVTYNERLCHEARGLIPRVNLWPGSCGYTRKRFILPKRGANGGHAMTRMRMGILLVMLIAGTTAGAVDIPAIIDAADPMPEDLGVVYEHRDFEDPALEAIWRRNELRDHAQALTDLESYLADVPDGPSKLRARYFAVRWHLQLHKYDIIEHRFADLQAAVTHAKALIEAAPEYPLAPDAVLPAVEQALYWGTADPIEGLRWAVFGAADERAKADAVFWDTVFETAARYVGRYPATPGAPRVLLALGYFLRQTPEGKAQAETVFQRLAAWPRDAYSERAIAYKMLHDFALERGDVAKATALAEEGMRECAGRLEYRDYAIEDWPKAEAGTPWAQFAKTGLTSEGEVLLEHPDWPADFYLGFYSDVPDATSKRKEDPPPTAMPETDVVIHLHKAVNGWDARLHTEQRFYRSKGPEARLDGMPEFDYRTPNLLTLPRFPVRDGLEIVPLGDGKLMRQVVRRVEDRVVVTLSVVERWQSEQQWQPGEPWWTNATIGFVGLEMLPASGPTPYDWQSDFQHYRKYAGAVVQRQAAPPGAKDLARLVKADEVPSPSVPAQEVSAPAATTPWTSLFIEKTRWTPPDKPERGTRLKGIQPLENRSVLITVSYSFWVNAIDFSGVPIGLTEEQRVLFASRNAFAKREDVLYTTNADRLQAQAMDEGIFWTYQVPLDPSTTLPSEKIDFPSIVNPTLIDGEAPFLFFGVRQRQKLVEWDEPRGGGVIALGLDGSERYNRSDLGYVDAVTVDTASPTPMAYALVQRRVGEFEQAHFVVALNPATGETLWEHHLYTLHDEFVRTLDRSIALVRGTAPLLAVSLGIMRGGSYSDYPRSIRLYTLDGEPRGSIRKAVLNHVADFDGDGTDGLLIRRRPAGGDWDAEIVTPAGEVLWQAPGKGDRWWVEAVGQFDAVPGADLVVRERDTFILLGKEP